MKKIQIKEDSGYISQRLDKFLAAELNELSRSKIQTLIKSGKILVNGKKVKAGYSLLVGDELLIKDISEEEFVLNAEDLKFPVLLETDDYFVIEKPAGVVVHPSESGHHKEGTVAHAVLDKVSSSDDFFDKLRPGIVHRLDKDTSGLLIIAKNEKAAEYFVQQFKDRNVKKHYMALVSGIPVHPEGLIDSPISRDLKNRKKMGISVAGTGKEAVSKYRLLESFEINEKYSVSLLDVEIMTGRTHQIRVHMEAIGHPVIGDSVYGSRNINKLFKEKFSLNRQFLHAYSLEFTDPESSESVKVKSELPAELDHVLKKIRDL